MRRREIRAAALGMQCLVVFALVCALHPGVIHGQEPRDLSKASDEDLIQILRTEPPTPELTEALRASRRRIFFEYVLLSAFHGTTGQELLNVTDHVIQLGMITRGIEGHLQRLASPEVAVEGIFQAIYHPDLHVYTVELDLRRVLHGSIDLSPDNTPLRVMVSAFGCHARWIQIDWEPGTRVFAAFSQGRALFEHRRAYVRGWTADGLNVWKWSGREDGTLKAIAALRLRDPYALLEAMRSDDPIRKWVATARTVMACRGLGEPFSSWWSGHLRTPELDRERLEPIRRKVIEALEARAENLLWVKLHNRFKLIDPEERMQEEE